MKQLRIGYLSTAGIGRKNWKAIYHSGNAVVAAVASRDLEKSRAYIADCQRQFAFAETPRAYGSYEELIDAPDVDALYVPLPTGLRQEFILRAAAAGKHILCEKPCAKDAAGLAAMLAACRKHSVQFLDGVMFMHNPRLPKIREVLDDGKSVGAIRRLATAFSFGPSEDFFTTNIRANGALEPAGCLGDLGWYSLRFALWTLNWELPVEVTGRILAQSEDLPGRPAAPTEFAATLLYPGGVSVELFASFLAAKQQWVHVSGRQGWLYVPDFVHPRNGYEPSFEVNRAEVRAVSDVPCPPGAAADDYGHATAQDTRMWRNFANQVFSGKINEEWLMWATKTQVVMDACLAAARRGTAVKL